MTPTEKKYREIDTIEGLDSAIRELRRSNREREAGLKVMVADMRDVYNPRAIAREGFRRATRSVSFWGIALNLVGFTRRLLMKK